MPFPHPDAVLRDACEARVDSLRLPHVFTTADLRRAVAESRGKPIILRPMSTLGSIEAPCGIRLESENADILFFEESTSLHHQRHILTHELCHIICDHPGSLELDPEAAQHLGISSTLIRRMSGRSAYSTSDEREAEMMATVIRHRIYRAQDTPAPEDGWDALFAQPLTPVIKKGWFRR